MYDIPTISDQYTYMITCIFMHIYMYFVHIYMHICSSRVCQKKQSCHYLSYTVGVLSMQVNGNVRAALSTSDVIEVRNGFLVFQVILL
jgi:hypothetical protein